MDERRLQQSGEAAFDALLESCVSELPPEDVVRTVTPWKTAMGRILWGMAMGSVTLKKVRRGPAPTSRAASSCWRWTERKAEEGSQTMNIIELIIWMITTPSREPIRLYL